LFGSFDRFGDFDIPRRRKRRAALTAEFYGIGVTGAAFWTLDIHGRPLVFSGKEYQLRRGESTGKNGRAFFYGLSGIVERDGF